MMFKHMYENFSLNIFLFFNYIHMENTVQLRSERKEKRNLIVNLFITLIFVVGIWRKQIEKKIEKGRK